jgi:hypothetical protein
MEALPANTEIHGSVATAPASEAAKSFVRPPKFAAAPSRDSESGLAARRLGIPLVFVLVALVGYNLVIARTARSSQRRQLLARIENIPADTDCLFLGNSLVEAGCDMQSFQSAWPNATTTPKAINVALGATSTVEHYLILKRALQNRSHLKYVIYGFFDDQLNTAPSGPWSDLIGNRALSYYFPDDAAAMYAPGSWLKKWQLRLTARIPMLAERSSLWGKVDALRRNLDEVGMPRHKTNRFGRVQDFGALEAADAASFERRCRAVTDGEKGFSRPVQEIIRLACQNGATVILVEMPMPSRHRNLFYSSPAWNGLRGHLTSLARKENAVYVSASDWIQDDRDFEDATHLNEQGARKFSSELAQAVARISGHAQVAERH